MKAKMKRSTIYLTVAAWAFYRFEQDYFTNYACEKIADLAGKEPTAELFPEFFMFEPSESNINKKSGHGWFGWIIWSDSNRKENSEHRIFALLFAHEIAKDNERITGK